jgi:hypothetical protein
MKTFRTLTMLALLLPLPLTGTPFGAAAGGGAPTHSAPAAEEWEHPAGFRFWLPDNWKAEGDDDTLTVEGQDGQVFIAFFVPKNVRSMGRAVEDIDEELSAWLKDIRFDKPSTSSEGGVNELFISGTGKDREDGTEMEFDLGFYEKKGKFLVVFGVTTAENFDRYHPTFKKILDSIK